jgi:hypothetical protein
MGSLIATRNVRSPLLASNCGITERTMPLTILDHRIA